MSAVSSMRLFVVAGSAPCFSATMRSSSTHTKPQPPGPGLPSQDPSVKTAVFGPAWKRARTSAGVRSTSGRDTAQRFGDSGSGASAPPPDSGGASDARGDEVSPFPRPRGVRRLGLDPVGAGRYIFVQSYMSNSFPEPSDLFRAFADPTRLRILSLLLEQKQLCVCDLCEVLDEIQPKVSRHLATLRRVGLVRVRRDGKWMIYSLADAPAPPPRPLLRCVGAF